MTNTIYIHQPEKAISFTRLPNFLFEAPSFKPLSNEAKVLYAFILRRAELSRKNGWADEYGRIYLYYPPFEGGALLPCLLFFTFPGPRERTRTPIAVFSW